MNFLLPLLVGGPDMAKKKDLQLDYYSVYKKSVNLFNSLSLFLQESKKESKERIKSNFNSYLAGLFEGDGHIWLSKNLKVKKHNPRFCITFGLKNEPLAKKLISILDCAHIRYKYKDNACVLTISPVKGLKRIVKLINGELRTPKIDQLYNLIDWLNKHHNSNISKLPLNEKSLGCDSWLSGFIDADGSFSIQHTKVENGAKKRKISCRLRIEQRMIYHNTNVSYYNILNKIAVFLGCNLLTRRQVATNKEYYTLTASSCKSLLIIINYFEMFPLFSSKYLDYLDWSKVVKLIINKKQYIDTNIIEIDLLKSNMNNQRTYFKWYHLNKLFYKF